MGNIVKFKGCKRCGGDLFLERDPEGSVYPVSSAAPAIFQRLVPPVIKSPKSKRYYAR